MLSADAIWTGCQLMATPPPFSVPNSLSRETLCILDEVEADLSKSINQRIWLAMNDVAFSFKDDLARLSHLRWQISIRDGEIPRVQIYRQVLVVIMSVISKCSSSPSILRCGSFYLTFTPAKKYGMTVKTNDLANFLVEIIHQVIQITLHIVVSQGFIQESLVFFF